MTAVCALPEGVPSANRPVLPRGQVDRIFERIFLAGKLDTPGMGFMYATPLMQAATYVPPAILAKYTDG